MKVNDLHSVVQGLDPRDTRKLGRPADKSTSLPQQSADGDSLDVTLSAHVSARSAETAAEDTTLSPARLAEIQGRIQTGFYGTTQILSDSAERILGFYSR